MFWTDCQLRHPRHIWKHTTEGILLPMLMTSPAIRESQNLVRSSGIADMNQSDWGISRKFGVLQCQLKIRMVNYLDPAGIIASDPAQVIPLWRSFPIV